MKRLYYYYKQFWNRANGTLESIQNLLRPSKSLNLKQQKNNNAEKINPTSKKPCQNKCLDTDTSTISSWTLLKWNTSPSLAYRFFHKPSKMKLCTNKLYPYATTYDIGLCDFIKWILFTIIYIMIMSFAQFIVLAIYNNNEVDMTTHGMLSSVN